MTPDQSQRDSPVTQLLREASHGNREAFDRLLPLVYDELKRVAQGQLSKERPDHTLSATALVHEAYVRLVGQERVEWSGRSHFFAVAAQAMRRVLVNYAEARRAQKRGGGARAVPLDEVAEVLSDRQADDVLDLDDALKRLAEFNERGARVVEYRFFGGLAHPEIAEVLGVSEVTVRRAWAAARAWLRRELGAGKDPAVTLGPESPS
ncbi:MAG: ECF-type sigma factor [Gemmatimonadales bacterium]